MDIGVVCPFDEFGSDLGAVRDFIQAAEDLGYRHLRILDHVLGADPKFYPEVNRSEFSHETPVHEPFTLMGYAAAMTKDLKLVTGVLVLPQRQTALVAKQAAEVDVLSGGRLRLGIGLGWNYAEYEALGQDFHNRGQRIEEQIAVLRALWTQEIVNFEGRWHHINHAGLNPLPVQRPIPIWMGAGGHAGPIPPERVLRRIARLADGWMPQFPLGEAGQETLARLHAYVREAGRNPDALGMKGNLRLSGKPPETWATEVKAWKEMGATHLSVETRVGGLRSPEEHIHAIQWFKEVTGV